jgi:hypothetical protein
MSLPPRWSGKAAGIRPASLRLLCGFTAISASRSKVVSIGIGFSTETSSEAIFRSDISRLNQVGLQQVLVGV